MKAPFITLEGVEGAGKTSLLQSLSDALQEKKIASLLTRAPGATLLGSELRKLLLDPRFQMDPLTELFLFFADRQDHLKKEIEPALSKGILVVCDRFHDSTIAYQGAGRGLGADMIEKLVKDAFPPIYPDLTLILDLSPEEGLLRKKHQQTLDRMELEALSFHRSVREYFLKLAKKESGRCRLIDASQSKEKVAEIALSHIMECIGAWKV